MSAERSPLLARMRTGSWLDQVRFPPLSWLVPGLIPEGLSLMVGGPKIGKSWLSLQVALGVARGGDVLGGISVRQRPVLLLALEDGDRRLQDRCRVLLGETPIPATLDYFTQIEPGMVVATIEAWLDELPSGAELPLVILDTLGKVMPPTAAGESSYQRDYRVAGRLKRICDEHPGMGLVVLHHDRKAQAEDFVDGVSGTNGIAGAADTVLLISRPRTEAAGLLKVTGRDVTEREYAVTMTDGRWSLRGDSLAEAASIAATTKHTAGLGDRSADVLRIVAEHPDGVTPGQVAAELAGLTGKDAGTYLGRLYDAGRVSRPRRGVYTPVESVESVESGESPCSFVSTLSTLSTPLLGGEAGNVRHPAFTLDHCTVCAEPMTVVEAGQISHPGCAA